jgi:SAM-dependent methyltransferase
MEQEKDWFEANRLGWEKKATIHPGSAFYALEHWKQGKTSLQAIELAEMGAVQGKSLLHLQCHFGQDTLSWARLGARVTGCDFSKTAIRTARQLTRESGLNARFVCCNVYDLKAHLKGKYDIVFTSYGTIGWLPDLHRWAEVIAHFLKKRGVFYIVDFHPVLWMLDDDMQALKYPYHNAEVIVTEQSGSYADRNAGIHYTEYGWNHSLSEIINALISKGLQIDFLHEFPYSPYDCFANTVQGDDGNFRIRGLENILPMLYSIRASKR